MSSRLTSLFLTERPIRAVSDMVRLLIPYYTPDITRNRIRRPILGIDITKLFQRITGSLKFEIHEGILTSLRKTLLQKGAPKYQITQEDVELYSKIVKEQSITAPTPQTSTVPITVVTVDVGS